MRTQGFRRDSDTAMLNEWATAWGQPPVEAEDLSSTGFIVYDEHGHKRKNILVGFMIMTNARFVLIETVCANPETSPAEREEAIIELVRVISKQAKELGFKKVLAFPQSARLAAKGEAAGMLVDPKPCRLLIKEVY